MCIDEAIDLNNALRIVVYPQTFIYRSERIEDKLGLLNAYKRVMEDHDDKPLDTPVSYKSSSASTGQQLHPEKEKYLVELPDQLEVLIALREFEKSVVYLEKGKMSFGRIHSVFTSCLFSKTYRHDLPKLISHHSRSKRTCHALYRNTLFHHQPRPEQHLADQDPVPTLRQLVTQARSKRKGARGLFGHTILDHQETNSTAGV